PRDRDTGRKPGSSRATGEGGTRHCRTIVYAAASRERFHADLRTARESELMRVLHLTSGNMYGGVETFLTTLAREATLAPDMQSEFALCWGGRLRSGRSHLGPAPHVLGHVRISRPHPVVRARHALRELLTRERFDVVVCHQPWPCVVFGSVVRRARLPLVLWVHMAGEGTHWRGGVCSRRAPRFAPLHPA